MGHYRQGAGRLGRFVRRDRPGCLVHLAPRFALTYNPRLSGLYHDRKGQRLRGFDYSASGAYFVTLCVQSRLCLFGQVVDGEMRRNAAGDMLARIWEEIPTGHPGVSVDAFIVMPNHVHGIVWLWPDPDSESPSSSTRHDPDRLSPLSLPQFMQIFKSRTTSAYIRGVNDECGIRFDGKLWQRSYHDQVVRNEPELEGIRGYIVHNAQTWATDPENPEAR